MEEWRDILGYEWRYQISSLWKVKSLYRIDNNNHPVKERLLKIMLGNRWYYTVNLHLMWKVKSFSLHRLLGINFIENPNNLAQINHKNWNKLDNSLENLEWVSQLDNIRHSFYVLWNKAWHHFKKRLIQISLTGKVIQEWDSARCVQRELWFAASTISKVLNWKREKAYWYKWEFVK